MVGLLHTYVLRSEESAVSGGMAGHATWAALTGLHFQFPPTIGLRGIVAERAVRLFQMWKIPAPIVIESMIFCTGISPTLSISPFGGQYMNR